MRLNHSLSEYRKITVKKKTYNQVFYLNSVAIAVKVFFYRINSKTNGLTQNISVVNKSSSFIQFFFFGFSFRNIHLKYKQKSENNGKVINCWCLVQFVQRGEIKKKHETNMNE